MTDGLVRAEGDEGVLAQPSSRLCWYGSRRSSHGVGLHCALTRVQTDGRDRAQYHIDSITHAGNNLEMLGSSQWPKDPRPYGLKRRLHSRGRIWISLSSLYP